MTSVMTRGELSIPYALRRGEIVHASELPAGGFQSDCLCPGCGSALVAKIGNRIREEHFAHPKRGKEFVECDYRTVCHRTGSHLLQRRITRQLTNGGGVWLTWLCSTCGETHELDLLQGIGTIKHSTGKGQPSAIALYPPYEEGEPQPLPKWIVEVSADGQQAAQIVDYHQKNQVPVWTVAARSMEDAEWLASDTQPLAPESGLGMMCPAPPQVQAVILHEVERYQSITDEARQPLPACAKCSRKLKRRHLYIHRFEANDLVAIVRYGRSGWLTVGPRHFSPAELQLAREHGAVGNKGPSFYDYFGDILNALTPIASLTLGCDECRSVVELAGESGIGSED